MCYRETLGDCANILSSSNFMFLFTSAWIHYSNSLLSSFSFMVRFSHICPERPALIFLCVCLISSHHPWSAFLPLAWQVPGSFSNFPFSYSGNIIFHRELWFDFVEDDIQKSGAGHWVCSLPQGPACTRGHSCVCSLLCVGAVVADLPPMAVLTNLVNPSVCSQSVATCTSPACAHSL